MKTTKNIYKSANINHFTMKKTKPQNISRIFLISLTKNGPFASFLY